MDVIKAEIAKKRKQLEERKLLGGDKKYFKRGDLIAQEQEEYLKKYRPNENVVAVPSSSTRTDLSDQNATATDTENDADGQPQGVLPRIEVIRRLRERCEPILLYGETEADAFRRLRQSEISEPEINRGFRNDFQEAMEQVDQAFLDQILKSHTQSGTAEEGASGSSSTDNKDGTDSALVEDISYEKIQDMARGLGRGNKDRDTEVILTLLEFLLKMWSGQVNSCSADERMSTKTKLARATYTQTRVYMRPLLRKLKNKTLPEDILDSLTDIAKLLLDRNYIKASDAYLQMAIGNAPWPIGVTMVGIHARTGREKIFSKNVAHVLNDETQRKYIQGLKRLMTKCQEYFPTDPSRCVEYVSKKDRVDE